MSPIGGVGINLAIQDAIAAANILAGPMRRGALRDADLRKVQDRRAFPIWATQAFQTAVQNRVVDPILKSSSAPRIPLTVRLMQHMPFLQRIPARLIGIGVRPEHIDLGLIDGHPG